MPLGAGAPLEEKGKKAESLGSSRLWKEMSEGRGRYLRSYVSQAERRVNGDNEGAGNDLAALFCIFIGVTSKIKLFS